jgi:type IV secretion system protein VirB10
MEQQYPSSAPLGLDEESPKKGRRTWGQKIIMFVFFLAVVIFAFVFMSSNAENVSQKQKKESQRGNRPATFADSKLLEEELFAAASRGGGYNTPAETASPDPVAAQQPKTQIIMVRAKPSVKTPPKKTERPLTDSEKELARRYRDMRSNAILSKSDVEGFGFTNEEGGKTVNARTDSTFVPPNHAAQYDIPPEAMQALMQGAQRDANGQSQKLDFLLKEGAGRTPQGYSENTRIPQIAKMELKAGTVIPGLLLTGLNSDLPGTIIGQVSENVYDSATGDYLLIPQGTRILGVYDSKITYGQKRINVVWNRLIYPDGSSLNINGSPGADLAGYSGIKGKVDNHYGQLLSAVLFTSVFASAADIATGGRDSNNNNNDNDKKSVRDIIVETAGAEIAQIGAKMADRALDIQPTIKVKPGQRFNVIVQQDVVFLKAWAPGNSSVPGF